MKLEGRTTRLAIFALIVTALLLIIIGVLLLNSPAFGPPIPQEELFTGLASATPTP